MCVSIKTDVKTIMVNEMSKREVISLLSSNILSVCQLSNNGKEKD